MKHAPHVDLRDPEGRAPRPVIPAANPPTLFSPVGAWHVQISRNGVITFDDHHRSGGNDALSATAAGTLTLQGPANWLLPADRQGALCDVEEIGAYCWATRAKGLVLTPTHDVCAARVSVLTGIWKRT